MFLIFYSITDYSLFFNSIILEIKVSLVVSDRWLVVLLGFFVWKIFLGLGWDYC